MTKDNLIGYVQDVPGTREGFLVRSLESGETIMTGRRRYLARISEPDTPHAERVVRPVRRGTDGGLWLDMKSEAQPNIPLIAGTVELLGCVVGRYVRED